MYHKNFNVHLKRFNIHLPGGHVLSRIRQMNNPENTVSHLSGRKGTLLMVSQASLEINNRQRKTKFNLVSQEVLCVWIIVCSLPWYTETSFHFLQVTSAYSTKLLQALFGSGLSTGKTNYHTHTHSHCLPMVNVWPNGRSADRLHTEPALNQPIVNGLRLLLGPGVITSLSLPATHTHAETHSREW